MPLITLKNLVENLKSFNYYYGGKGNFTQKSIPFGSDQPGGLSSGEPYVQWPLPEKATQATADYYVGNKAGLDYPLRGNSLQVVGEGVVVAQSAGYDFTRIRKFINSTPKGKTFITKQVGLQLTNPKIEVGQQANLAPGDTTARFYGLIENTRIYNNGLNTLAQVKLAGSGIHADRHGTVPYNPRSTTYEKVVTSYNQKKKGEGNRLVTLLRNKILQRVANKENQYSTNVKDKNDIKNTQYFNNLDNLLRLGIPQRNQNILFQYAGGPGSTYGIGFTTIPRSDNNNFLYLQNSPAPLYTFDRSQLLFTELKDVIATQNSFQEGINRPGYVEGLRRLNFNSETAGNNTRLAVLQRQLFITKGDEQVSPIYGANVLTKGSDTRTNILYTYTIPNKIGDSTTVNLRRSTYTDLNTDTLTQEGQDYVPNNRAATFNYNLFYTQKQNKTGQVAQDFRAKIKETYNTVNIAVSDYSNQAQLKRGDGTTPDPVNLLDVGQDYNETAQDLIKFKFEALEYASEIYTVPFIFRAYLTSMQDTNTSEWTPYKYIGRGENFYTYNGASRGITFNFRIAAQDPNEMKPLYRKLNYLVSQIYPDYTQGTGFMRAPLVNLTIGDYISAQPGFLTSVGLTIPQDSPWEIGSDIVEYQLPHVLDVACQFTPIHNFLPRRSYITAEKQTKISPFITPLDVDNKFKIIP